MSTSTYTPTASGSGSHPPSRSTAHLAPLVPILPASNSTSNSNWSALPRARKPPIRPSTSTNDGIEYHQSNLKGSKGKGKAKASMSPSSSSSMGNGAQFSEGLNGGRMGGGTVCAVIDRWGGDCREYAVGVKGARVCKEHLEEGHLLTRELRKCMTTMAAFPDPVIYELSFIQSVKSLDVLSNYETILKQRWEAVDLALKYTDYYRAHFPGGEGMSDLSSRDLEMLREVLQEGLDMILDQLHLLILHSESALWLLIPPTPSPACLATPSPPLSPPPPPILPLAAAKELDPIKAVEMRERSEVLELLSLSGSHASFIEDARKSVERVRVVECLFRRLITRDRELLVRAYRGGHDHVLRFFEDPSSCSLSSLRRLHAALQKTTVLLLKEAISDAFRAIQWEESGAGETEEGDAGAGLQLLGGWTYMIGVVEGREMGGREWGHLYDLNGCPGCALRCCSSFHEWSLTRRLTVIPHGPLPPPYLYWGDQKESDACKVFRALDLVKCSEERTGNESEIRKVGGGFVGTKGKGVFVERLERNWLFFKMSLTHLKASSILTALYNSHSVIVRSRATPLLPLLAYPLPPPSHLWYSRHRSAPSKAELKHQSFQTDPDAFGIGNSHPASILASLDALDSPEKLQGMKVFEGTYEIVVMDGFGREGEGSGMSAASYVMRSFEQFENEIGQLVLEATGLRDVKGALEWGEAESYRKGELLFDFGGSIKKIGGGREKELTTVEKAVKVIRDGGSLNDLLPLKAVEQMSIKSGGKKKKKEKAPEGRAAILESLRDDSLAFKLSRSLFR